MKEDITPPEEQKTGVSAKHAQIVLAIVVLSFIAYLICLYFYPAYIKITLIPLGISLLYAWYISRRKKKSS